MKINFNSFCEIFLFFIRNFLYINEKAPSFEDRAEKTAEKAYSEAVIPPKKLPPVKVKKWKTCRKLPKKHRTLPKKR